MFSFMSGLMCRYLLLTSGLKGRFSAKSENKFVFRLLLPLCIE
uniref:Uncharacterized protein n=1 Tax=Klebsiella pneumoniae TaxID=573 RepID=A0A3Q9W1Y9_KLEPN|nr:hypothetical protein CN549_0143 [Klebsiella pneumoniae]UNB13078.1 hypothetical protein [Escherichia coli]AZZ86992.1 hypothetical protein [Klebsiella pneumoniae]QAR16647.1 hypothetical protein [Klebsiella pneumoniae]QIK04244.1 hypothetical protein [Klebsiella pneumoniae]